MHAQMSDHQTICTLAQDPEHADMGDKVSYEWDSLLITNILSDNPNLLHKLNYSSV